MRRSSYYDRAEKAHYAKASTKSQVQDLNFHNLKFSAARIPQNNFISSRTPIAYFQPRPTKSHVHRPFTTQKVQSYLDHRRDGHNSFSSHNKHLTPKDLSVNSMREHHQMHQSGIALHDNNKYEHSKGRLYRGSSWKYDQKGFRDYQPATTRYNSNTPQGTNHSHKRDSSNYEHDASHRPRRSGGLLDLLGQNLKKADPKEEQFFEYIMRFSYRTKKGYIPTNSGKVNQDNYVVNPNINNHTWQHFFSVCDGHGPLGHHVSAYIKNALPNAVANCKNLDRNPKQALIRAYQTAYQKLLKESGIDLSFSGSTVISCYFNQNKLYCANVGDSRAILGRFKSGVWDAVPLSTDHKPSLQKEAERIRKMKGRVEAFKDEFGEPIGPLRVWVQGDNVPGLAMTRSFGDLVGASVGVSPIPEVKEFNLTQDDRIVLIASDGVFEFLSNEALLKSLIPYYQAKQIQQASDHLMTLSTKSWNKNSSIIDDITFVLIFISYNEL